MDLVEECYHLARELPKEELFALGQQIRKASVSIPANIAEGYGRDNRGDYVHHLRIAQGSLKELETHLLIAARVGLTAESRIATPLSNSDRLGRILRSLIRSLETPR